MVGVFVVLQIFERQIVSELCLIAYQYACPISYLLSKTSMVNFRYRSKIIHVTSIETHASYF